MRNPSFKQNDTEKTLRAEAFRFGYDQDGNGASTALDAAMKAARSDGVYDVELIAARRIAKGRLVRAQERDESMSL